MASSLRRMTTHGRATAMPAQTGYRAALPNACRRVVNPEFGVKVGRGCGRGMRRVPPTALAKSAGRPARLAFCERREGRARHVRIEATRTPICPSLLRRGDENVHAASRTPQATSAGRSASLMTLTQNPSAKPRVRVARRSQLSKNCCDGLTEAGRVGPERGRVSSVAFELHNVICV
jgi:hypothetical protein